MAKVIVGHHPDLTPQDAMEVFERHFAGKYEVYMNKSLFLPNRDFVVRKSAWTAAVFSLKQTGDETAFTFIVTAPSVVRRVIGVAFFLLIWALASRRAYRKMEDEMKSFIENAEEFK